MKEVKIMNNDKAVEILNSLTDEQKLAAKVWAIDLAYAAVVDFASGDNNNPDDYDISYLMEELYSGAE